MLSCGGIPIVQCFSIQLLRFDAVEADESTEIPDDAEVVRRACVWNATVTISCGWQNKRFV